MKLLDVLIKSREILLDRRPVFDEEKRISEVTDIYNELGILAKTESLLTEYEQICNNYLNKMDSTALSA